MRARRVDATQAEIVTALEEEGCGVISIASVGGGVPDLLVRRMTYRLVGEFDGIQEWDLDWTVYLVECKTRTGKLRASQQRLIDQGWPIVVLRSAEEARSWAKL